MTSVVRRSTPRWINVLIQEVNAKCGIYLLWAAPKEVNCKCECVKVKKVKRLLIGCLIQVLVVVEDEVRGQVEIGNVLEPGRTVVEPRGDGWTL